MARIEPLPPGTLPDDVRVALEGWLRPGATEVIKPLDTLARHPDLALPLPRVQPPSVPVDLAGTERASSSSSAPRPSAGTHSSATSTR